MSLEIALLACTFLVLILIGMPIAYSIGIATLVTMLVSIDSVPTVATLAQRMASGLNSFTLLAIPFFVLAGNIMNRGGIATRLITLAKLITGKQRGAMAFVNVISNMLFGAVSGSAAASASAIGTIMKPEMKKEGYADSFSAAINVSSSTTGLSIPPSNVLIVYSLASGGVSVSALFLAGYIPGILTGLALIIVGFGMLTYQAEGLKITLLALLKMIAVIGIIMAVSIAIIMSGLQTEYQYTLLGLWFFGLFGLQFYRSGLSILEGAKVIWDASPSLALLFIVIVGIVNGMFTATEASAFAVVYSLILSMIYKELKVSQWFDVMLNSVRTTCMVLFLVSTSMALSWIFALENIPLLVSEGMLSISDNPIVVLLLINVVLLVVGSFMDITPAILIFTPIFLPIVQSQLGIDPIHFGIIMTLNLSIGLCTPPVGSILFVGCSITGIPVEKVIKSLIPFLIAMIIVLLLVSYFPEISLWLPRTFES